MGAYHYKETKMEGVYSFHNPVHLTKYDIWKKFGFCPPRTKLQQRIDILEGKIDILEGNTDINSLSH